MNININDIKNGMTLIINGNLCLIQYFQHVKPGKGPAFCRIKFKNLKTGSIIEETFNTNIKFETAHVEKLKMQYLYNQGDLYVFMNVVDYSQLEINSEVLDDNIPYLKEGLEIEVHMYDGNIIGIYLPDKIEYEVTETIDATKGNTTNNAYKDATIETGLIVKVPLFIKTGEKIVITTKDGKYSSKA
ncbi:MAG: elongation factor P [Bacilli bacterium]|nr:elongation factor P [Bacilli bacterium]